MQVKSFYLFLYPEYLSLRAHTITWKVMEDNTTSILLVEFWPGYPAINRGYTRVVKIVLFAQIC